MRALMDINVVTAHFDIGPVMHRVEIIPVP